MIKVFYDKSIDYEDGGQVEVKFPKLELTPGLCDLKDVAPEAETVRTKSIYTYILNGQQTRFAIENDFLENLITYPMEENKKLLEQIEEMKEEINKYKARDKEINKVLIRLQYRGSENDLTISKLESKIKNIKNHPIVKLLIKLKIINLG